MQKICLFLLLILVSGGLSARDFQYTRNGQTLTYTVLDENARTVETKQGYLDKYHTMQPGNWVSDGLIIPSTVTNEGKTYTVTAIGNYSFYQNWQMQSLVLPNTVKRIGECAFSGCYHLGYNVLSNTLTKIDKGAFEGCWEIISITLPNSLISIGESAFAGCKILEKIDIPNSVTDIDRNAFEDCYKLKDVRLGNSVRTIGESAFSGCRELTTITIPESISSIGAYAFSQCEKLTEITYNAENANFLAPASGWSYSSPFSSLSSLRKVTIGEKVKYIPESAFSGRNITNLTEVIFKATDCEACGRGAFSGSVKTIIIEDNVKRIPDYAFEGCALSTVAIGNSVTSIGDYAFNGCSNLLSLTLPNSVKAIGDNAFEYCRGLRKIDLGNSVSNIGKNAFGFCSELYSIDLPNSLTAISEGMFWGCTSLRDITFGNSIKSINPNAFRDCDKLYSIEIPNSVVAIGENAFYDCGDLKSVTLGNSVETIGDEAFSRCMGLATITLPNSIKSIGKDAFNWDVFIKTVNIESPNIWSKVILGNSQSNPISQAHAFYVSDWKVEKLVLDIGSIPVSDYSFYDADNLSTVRIKGCGVGTNSFANCSNINALCLDVAFLSKLSFGDCPNIKSIYCLTEEPPEAPNDAFTKYQGVTVYVPYGSASKYENARSCWSHFANIVESDFSNIDKMFKADYYDEGAGLEDIFNNGDKDDIDLKSSYKVYNLDGVLVSTSVSYLKPGLYIIKQGRLTKKLLIPSE